jgi:inositol-hexakisphosphate 5-kinase
MQVFNVNTGKYLCHNKYYGRSLTPNGFKKAISQFFNNTDNPDQV